MKPKKYDMKKEEDVRRWFKEMEGYLKLGSETKTDFIYQGPRIELFARNRFDGWDCYGDQLSDTIQKNLI